MKITIKTKEIEFEWSQNMKDAEHSSITNSESSNTKLLDAISKIIIACTDAHLSIVENQLKNHEK